MVNYKKNNTMEIEFLKGQLIAYSNAIDIVGSEASICDDMRDNLAIEIIEVLYKTGDFSRYLVEIIPEQIWRVINGLNYYDNHCIKLSKHDLNIITNYLCRDLNKENKEIKK